MKMKFKKCLALVMALAVMVSLLASCGDSSGSSASTGSGAGGSTSQSAGSGSAAAPGVPEEPVTIRFLHKGPKPDGWDEVYEKYLELTKDTLNIQLDVNWVEHADYKEKLNLEITSGSDWDLVFDATFVQLRNLAAEGYYADLSPYFNNPEEYPGLASAFSAETMDANMWYGSMCYIPLFETYGNGIPVIWYRQDLAKEWGIGDADGQISSYDEMEAFWQAAKDSGMIPYGASQSRGFFQQFTFMGKDLADAGIMSFTSAGLTIWTYTADGELKAVAVEGSGDENFKDFPEGYQYDFGAERYKTFAEWQQAGYIDPDSLSCTDYETPFHNGLSASIIGTLDDYVKYTSYEDTLGEDAVGFFVYADDIRDMKEGAITVDYSGNNGLCVPASSTKIPYTMKFLDWLFGSQEAHDLFQLGLEGRDFEYNDDGTYTTLTNYSADFGGYGWTWNPNYAMISSSYDGRALEYREYEYSDAPFSPQPVLGFHFETSDVDLSTAVAQCKAITDMVSTVKLHGISTDGNGVTYDSITDMLKANVDQAMENGGQQIVDALKEQLTDYLASA